MNEAALYRMPAAVDLLPRHLHEVLATIDMALCGVIFARSQVSLMGKMANNYALSQDLP